MKFVSALLVVFLISASLGLALEGDEYRHAWHKVFDGRSGVDSVTSLKVDPNDQSFYLVGSGQNLTAVGSGSDWWIKKFYQNGTEIISGWNKTFDSTNGVEQATSIDINPTNGDVYIGGYGSNLMNSSSGRNWWIKKFNDSGDEYLGWNLTVYANGAGGVQGVGYNSEENALYVVGYGTNIISGTSDADWWSKKFWENGTEDTLNWNKTYDRADDLDAANAVAFDYVNDTVYVIGYDYPAPSSINSDWRIRKYYFNGTEIDESGGWNKSINVSLLSSLFDRASQVEVDPNDGSVYVGGFGLIISATINGHVKKFFSNGTEIDQSGGWNKTFAFGTSISPVDTSDGGIFIIMANTSAVFVNKFFSNGTEDSVSWNKTFYPGSGLPTLDPVNQDLYVVASGSNLVGAGTSGDWGIRKFQGSHSGISCYFIANNTCPSGTVKLIGAANDSWGYTNAHAEISTQTNYNYSLCCNNTDPSITMGNACNQATVIKLNDTTNSHVEIGSNTNYANSACLNSTYQIVTCTYSSIGSCASGSQCILSMASSEGDNATNAHVGDCYFYSETACCGLLNNAPSAPVLTYPDNASTVYDRRLNFSWNASTDPEGNAITYMINATCGAACTCNAIGVTGLTGVNYTHSSDLCVDVLYNWTVTACDIYSACNTSLQFNFTVASQVIFDLFVNSSDFGAMAISQSKQTDTGTPAYMVGRNDGNVLINGTLNASALFSSVGMNNDTYNFRVADNETGSIVSSCSQTTYTPMNTSQKDFFCNLSYYNSSDEVRLHLNITVPANEPPGSKNSVIEVIVVKAE